MTFLRLLVIALIVGVAVTACGGTATPTATPEPPTASPEPATQPATPTPAPTDTPAPTATPAPPTPTPAPPTPTAEPSGVVNAEPSLNLRATPSTDGKLLGTIPSAAKIGVIGRSADNEWLRVRTTDVGEGWVKSEFVDLSMPIGTLPEVPLSGTASATSSAASASPTVDSISATVATPSTASPSTPAEPVALPARRPRRRPPTPKSTSTWTPCWPGGTIDWVMSNLAAPPRREARWSWSLPTTVRSASR